MSFIDNLPITKTFEDLKLNNNNEIPIKFQVPPNLITVTVLIEAEVMNISKGKTEHLKNNFQITMDTKNSYLSFYDCHLRKFKNEYFYYVLGKNGEPLADVNVLFNLNHSIYSQNYGNITLVTDDEGKINLGALEDISHFTANFNGPNGSCVGNYTIDCHKEKVSLPGALNVLEDEDIELPFVCNKEFSSLTCSLIRYAEDTVTNPYNNRTLSNCFSQIKFSHEKGYQYGKITISGLERGYYQLTFNTTKQTIAIRVHKGVYWETDSFILKDHSLVEKRDTTNLIRIKDISLEEEKEGHRLKFGLSGHSNTKTARAHVFAFTFMPTDSNFIYTSLEKSTKDWGTLDIFPFAKWENIYLSNRKLGDEFRYVFDRKFMSRFMGNTLDRPQLLLNRHKIRDTQFDQEVVNSGEVYQQQGKI
jgi:hypothetical protein